MNELIFDDAARAAAARLIGLALAEDLHDVGDLTSQALIAPTSQGQVAIVARRPGVLAGLPVAEMVFGELDADVRFDVGVRDGSMLEPGVAVATISGAVGSLLTGERTALNFLTHLSGIATLTGRFVDAVAGTGARILDTRKTTPGWRDLEKYAVRAGGGTNHRMGLYDGILIKDNHLAAWEAEEHKSIAAAVKAARKTVSAAISVEVEVDTLEQLADALTGKPGIVLLDNMTPEVLRRAVQMRDERAAGVLLEASGGITLETVREIAETGVDRISIGALTHSAVALDLAFDWRG